MPKYLFHFYRNNRLNTRHWKLTQSSKILLKNCWHQYQNQEGYNGSGRSTEHACIYNHGFLHRGNHVWLEGSDVWLEGSHVWLAGNNVWLPNIEQCIISTSTCFFKCSKPIINEAAVRTPDIFPRLMKVLMCRTVVHMQNALSIDLYP